MFHLTTALDAASGVPLYEQLYESLAAEMRAGAIPAGTRMPGKRRLAAELSVSVWEEPCDSGAEPAVPEQAVRDNSSTAANNVHNHFSCFILLFFVFMDRKKEPGFGNRFSGNSCPFCFPPGAYPPCGRTGAKAEKARNTDFVCVTGFSMLFSVKRGESANDKTVASLSCRPRTP